MNTVTDPLTVANELRPVLLRLSRQVRRELHHLDLSAGKVSILGRVADNPGIGIGALAELERVSQPRMSKVVGELIDAGFCSTSRGADRRRVGVDLTAEGAAALLEVRRTRTAWLAKRLERLAPDELAAVEAAILPLARLIEEAD